eukprot:TRINITY_DN6579_c0_g3_i1.p1 TRINITY_DN6579_c0_g3~~TRINITY_DN6579_c0_g3_i1.p1  ORF type:complete len:451 (-),score=107.81 TRINITY_DN6579_c0_g3_i1:55-1407(-)
MGALTSATEFPTAAAAVAPPSQLQLLLVSLLLLLRLRASHGDGEKWIDVPPGESAPCWNSVFTADRCCAGSGDPGCWDEGSGYNFEKCCDEEAREAAASALRRWAAMRDAGSDSGLVARGCALALPAAPARGGHVEALRHFALSGLQPAARSDLPPRRAAASAATAAKRSDAARGGAGACSNGDGRGDASNVRMLTQLQRAGVRLAGWVVNFGAGGWRDAMHVLMRAANLSGIFVDPLGARGATPLPGVRFVTAAAAPHNICELLAQGGLPCPVPPGRLEIDAMKVDIDSFDCELAKAALRVLRPKLIWMEINWSIPPPLRFSRKWHPEWFDGFLRVLRTGRVLSTFGCSLSEAMAVLRDEGYSLHVVDGAGDAVFADDAVAAHLGATLRGVDEALGCFNEVEGHIHVPEEWAEEWSILPPREALHRVWCNFSLHDQLLGLAEMPFTLGL